MLKLARGGSRQNVLCLIHVLYLLQNRHLGYYKDEEAAAKVYDHYVITTRGPDAPTNFTRPPNGELSQPKLQWKYHQNGIRQGLQHVFCACPLSYQMLMEYLVFFMQGTMPPRPGTE